MTWKPNSTEFPERVSLTQESHVFIRSDNMEVNISLARVVSLECGDGSLCIGCGLEREWEAETPIADSEQPPRMGKIGWQVKEDMGLKEPIYILF